jgi:hypothetical protein
MQMNVSSPETSYDVEVDAVHMCGRQYHHARNGKGLWFYRGLRQLHGIRWRICELGRSICVPVRRITKTSSEEQELVKDAMEVGLTGSTQRTGKPATRGSGQQRCNAVRYNADTQWLERQHG